MPLTYQSFITPLWSTYYNLVHQQVLLLRSSLSFQTHPPLCFYCIFPPVTHCAVTTSTYSPLFGKTEQLDPPPPLFYCYSHHFVSPQYTIVPFQYLHLQPCLRYFLIMSITHATNLIPPHFSPFYRAITNSSTASQISFLISHSRPLSTMYSCSNPHPFVFQHLCPVISLLHHFCHNLYFFFRFLLQSC